MKITFLSDTHTLHNEVSIEPCDIFCYCGDATNIGGLVDWISFFEWMRQIPARHIVWIAGNHDKSLDKQLMLNTSDSVVRLINTQAYNDLRKLIADLPAHIHYLENKSVTIEGINFYGTPVSPAFGQGWAFNRIRGEAIAKEWAKIPKNTNILLTHSPPYAILDYVEGRYKRFPEEDQHTGCEELLNRIKFSLPQLKISAFGHIHGNTGFVYKYVSQKRTVCFVNACLIENGNRFLTRQPITLDYKLLLKP